MPCYDKKNTSLCFHWTSIAMWIVSSATCFKIQNEMPWTSLRIRSKIFKWFVYKVQFWVVLFMFTHCDITSKFIYISLVYPNWALIHRQTPCHSWCLPVPLFFAAEKVSGSANWALFLWENPDLSAALGLLWKKHFNQRMQRKFQWILSFSKFSSFPSYSFEYVKKLNLILKTYTYNIIESNKALNCEKLRTLPVLANSKSCRYSTFSPMELKTI